MSLTWAKFLLVSKTDERFVVDLGMQWRIRIQRKLGANSEEGIRGARGPLHADTTLNLIRHLLVDGTTEFLSIVSTSNKKNNIEWNENKENVFS